MAYRGYGLRGFQLEFKHRILILSVHHHKCGGVTGRKLTSSHPDGQEAWDYNDIGDKEVSKSG
jgi:hypothetical protein